MSCACAVNVLWQIKCFPSHVILLPFYPQRPRSPRVPASVCLCPEASNNCSSPPLSLFASYKGSAPSVLPVPVRLEGLRSNIQYWIWLRLQQFRWAQTPICNPSIHPISIPLVEPKPADVGQENHHPLLRRMMVEQAESWRLASDLSRLFTAKHIQYIHTFST